MGAYGRGAAVRHLASVAGFCCWLLMLASDAGFCFLQLLLASARHKCSRGVVLSGPLTLTLKMVP